MELSQVVCSSPPFCKLEPESPPSWDTPVDFNESNFGEYWPDDCEDEKESVGIKHFNAGDILLDLDMLMKEEQFPWIDERNESLYTSNFEWAANDIKVFNNIPTPPALPLEHKPFNCGNATASSPSSISGGAKYYQPNVHTLTSSATPDLLREFEDVLINTTTGSLTPPESPKDQTTSLITLLQEIEPCASSSNEIDAIVATQAENMVSHNSHIHHEHQTQQQQLPPLSPDPWSSPSVGSSSSSSGSCSDSGYDDPDWSPSSPSQLQSSFSSNNTNTSSTRKKRAAATTTEERKMRKKEQNKNAATRYRQKKKQEIEVIIGEERELMEKHDHLKADVTEITREIRYLKSLLRDLYKAKGLITS